MEQNELACDAILGDIVIPEGARLFTEEEVREVNAQSAELTQKLMESNEALLPQVQSRTIIG